MTRMRTHRAIVAVIAALTSALWIVPSWGVAAGSTPRAPKIGPDLHSLVVSPTAADQLFVGGHYAVATSSTAGQRWRSLPSLAGADAMGWGFRGSSVWVSGHPGLNRSDDGGQTFRRTNAGLPDTDLHAFGAGATILYGASPAVGVFASTDDGRSWQQRTNQVGRSFFGRIVVDPNDPDHVLAADAANGPVESRDGARTWRRLGGLTAAGWLSASTDLTHLAASGPAGAVSSADGGKTWTRLRLPKGAQLAELQADQPATLYAAANVGGRARVWVSHDSGSTWVRT